MNNWKPQEFYTPSRFGVDGLIVIECVAFALLAFAATWIEYLT
jgi:hypothetical protein